MNTKNRYTKDRASIWKGAAAGVIAGVAGSWTMNTFQELLSETRKARNQPQNGTEHGNSNQQREPSEAEDPATVKVARAASCRLFDHELRENEKAFAGNLVHYAMGVGSGAVYGAVAEVLPAAILGCGLLFGTVLWLAADEGIVPALGVSKSPSEYPTSTHVSAWASHLIYGVTVQAIRRITVRLF